MSLSGLETPAVDGAYQTVLEKGGWFFLRYTARDAVDVLAQGVGGVVEMRDAAAASCKDESASLPSPLFGMIHFRRRKVLVKIIVEGTSRLVQARAQVHWGSVTTRFADHDSTCEISAPEQLTEIALTANTDLHSSRSSANSGNSKIGALHGIEEGAEEINGSNAKPSASIDEPKEEKPLEKPPPSIIEPSTEPFPSFTTPPPSEEPPRLDSKSDYNITLTPADYSPDPDRRLSTQSARRSGTDLFGAPLDFSFLEKPKVKLGPRPSMMDKRMSSSRTSAEGPRATAALPAGLRAGRTGSNSSRPKSRDSTKTVPADVPATGVPKRFPAPPPIPETPPTMILVPRPRSSGGSVKSLPATLPKSGMSKEKQRLMKFREMYKQKESKKGKSPVAQSPVIMEEGAAKGGAMPETVSSRGLKSSAVQHQGDGQQNGNIIRPEDDPPARKDEVGDRPGAIEAQEPTRNALLDDSTGGSGLGIGVQRLEKPDQPTETEGGATERKGGHLVGLTGERSAPEPEASHESNSKPFGKNDQDKSKSVDSTVQNNYTDERTGDFAPEGPISQSNEDLKLANKAKSHGETKSEVDEIAETPTTEEHAVQDMASPTSMLESSGQTSTRPTSVSESNGHTEPDTVSRHSHKASNDFAATSEDTVSGKQPHVEESGVQASEISEPTPTAISPSAEDIYVIPEPKVEEEADRHLDQPVQNETRNLSISTQMSVDQPIRQSMALDQSATEVSSVADYDDDLVDELQAAVLQEAKPVAVSKSPIAAIIPRKGSVTGFRAFSTPHKRIGSESVGSNSTSSSPFSVRLRSASSVGNSDKQADDKAPYSGKRVGGGIAAKIADLQRSFSRGSQANTNSPAKEPVPSTKIVAQRASSLEPLNSLSSPKRLSSLITKQTSPGDESDLERTPSPPRNSHHNLAVQHPSVSTVSPVPSHASQIMSTPRSETISVRTTITRPDPSPMLPKEPATAPTSPELISSPVMGSFHQRAKSVVTSPRLFRPSGRSASVSSLRSQPTSPNNELFGFSHTGEGGNSSGWRSIGTRLRRMSESRSKSPQPAPTPGLPRSMSNSSLDTAVSGESGKTDKKSSRTSRLFKRMSTSISSLSTSPRMQLETLSEKGASELQRQEAVRPKGISVGDLNVQFPDTLLWKRRWVEIDDAGYLVLKPTSSASETLNNSIIKRYHLSEFQPPFPPDVDRQELGNSIVLDFRDGRTLQCACQSPLAQRQTLHMLLEYHMAWLD